MGLFSKDIAIIGLQEVGASGGGGEVQKRHE